MADAAAGEESGVWKSTDSVSPKLSNSFTFTFQNPLSHPNSFTFSYSPIASLAHPNFPTLPLSQILILTFTLKLFHFHFCLQIFQIRLMLTLLITFTFFESSL